MESQPEFWRKAGRDDYSFILKASKEFQAFGPYTEIIAGWLKDPWVETWVYREKAGFLMLGPLFPPYFRPYIDVMAIYVSPERRRKGIGSKMLHLAEERARKKGYQFLRAHVGCENLSALRLFQKAGFEIKKKIENYYPSGLSAFELQKKIKTSR